VSRISDWRSKVDRLAAARRWRPRRRRKYQPAWLHLFATC